MRAGLLEQTVPSDFNGFLQTPLSQTSLVHSLPSQQSPGLSHSGAGAGGSGAAGGGGGAGGGGAGVLQVFNRWLYSGLQFVIAAVNAHPSSAILASGF